MKTRHAQHAFLALILMVLAGCATLGLEQPQGFTDRAAYAGKGLNAVIGSTTSSLDLGAIGSDDAIYVRGLAVQTRTFLTAAETAFASGDISTAEGRLALAEAVLGELKAYLLKKGVKVNE